MQYIQRSELLLVSYVVFHTRCVCVFVAHVFAFTLVRFVYNETEILNLVEF